MRKTILWWSNCVEMRERFDRVLVADLIETMLMDMGNFRSININLFTCYKEKYKRRWLLCPDSWEPSRAILYINRWINNHIFQSLSFFFFFLTYLAFFCILLCSPTIYLGNCCMFFQGFFSVLFLIFFLSEINI